LFIGMLSKALRTLANAWHCPRELLWKERLCEIFFLTLSLAIRITQIL
jgi:hypothetical protein